MKGARNIISPKDARKNSRPQAFPKLPYRSKLGYARIRKAVLAVVKARTARDSGGAGV